jgi:hypothetical protein
VGRDHAWQSNLVAKCSNLGTGPQRKKTAPGPHLSRHDGSGSGLTGGSLGLNCSMIRDMRR